MDKDIMSNYELTNDIPVFILCGGMGTRLKEETEFKPKPMVPVGNEPILLHIMKLYRKHGFKQFILCLGFKSEVIKEYFLNYSALNSDFTVDLESQDTHFHTKNHNLDMKVTMAYTGELTMTGARIARAASRYIGDSEHFAVTYGDGLTDANLSQEFQFHIEQDRIGTVLGVNPPSRFGEIIVDKNSVLKFDEKPEFKEKWINGGFFYFKRDFISYLSTNENCILERKPLVKLAEDRQLSIYKHKGFWGCMDTQRDRDYLNDLMKTGKAPWL